MDAKKEVDVIDIISGKMWKIFDIPIFGGGSDEVLKILEKSIFMGHGDGSIKFVATINPEFVVASIKDKNFKRILKEKTDLNVCDGIGLIWAKQLLCPNSKFQILNKLQSFLSRLWLGFGVGVSVLTGKYSDRIVAGSSLMKDICILAAKKKWKVFFLGGWGDRSARVAENFKSLLQRRTKEIQKFKYESCEGRPRFSDSKVLEKIKESKAKILFVAYGMKKQEEWIDKNLEKLEKAGVRLVMGVGRSMDYYSGDLKRAPKIVRKMGLEWLYSLYKEPKRWKRQLVLPKFVWKVLTDG
ncbi:WecB/TagA/CpsF family glycosyltransferase [Patescibacteria group bacterium]|nr:WecB/TagA/CpsF family glycosyltransferase [Patescibacteria group bacterium]